MESVLNTIKEQNLFKNGEVVAVATSGGSDSIALLHFLNENKDNLDIEVCAVHVDHCLRENSALDAAFVSRFCKDNHIRLYKFKVDAGALAKSKNIGTEEAAREARYGVFDTLIKKGITDKIALGHHMSDQAETVLLHLFRGAGINGATGMDYLRGNYVRPMLNTEKYEIIAYIYNNHLEHVEDESNQDNKYERNFIRNKIMPLIKTQWRGIDKTLCNFASLARQDDKFLNGLAEASGIIFEKYSAKIPLNYFIFDKSLISRTILKAINGIDAAKDIERKHIMLIEELAKAENGTGIDLPNGVKAIKEYEYIVITKNPPKKQLEEYAFKTGKLNISDFGHIFIKKTVNFAVLPNVHMIDAGKLPKNVKWRKRKEGDIITKFGGGTKTLKAYMIEKKVPSRLRDSIPVLALGNEIFVVACVDISDKVKITNDTTSAYAIEYILEN